MYLVCHYKTSGKNLLISINRLAVNKNQKAATTGAVDKYVVKFFIDFNLNFYKNNF